MAFWIELHCDNPSDSRPEEHMVFGKPCRSDQNVAVPSAMAKNRAAIPTVLRIIEGDAKQAGWKRTRTGWLCDNCATFLATKEPSHD